MAVGRRCRHLLPGSWASFSALMWLPLLEVNQRDQRDRLPRECGTTS